MKPCPEAFERLREWNQTNEKMDKYPEGRKVLKSFNLHNEPTNGFRLMCSEHGEWEFDLATPGKWKEIGLEGGQK